jgi:hypothetical protein
VHFFKYGADEEAGVEVKNTSYPPLVGQARSPMKEKKVVTFWCVEKSLKSKSKKSTISYLIFRLIIFL